jgi:dTDP-4-amino-4,6-dideoxygalactose transaminase
MKSLLTQGIVPVGFNKPYMTGKEVTYIQQAAELQKLSGDGLFTKKCHGFFEDRYQFLKALLTPSCTAALEMAALLIDIQPGDEVIMPSYTFPSTANAFALRGARIVFADSSPQHPNLDVSKLSSLIGPKTRAIVVVHYAGTACDMKPIMELAERKGIFVIEDAAQAINNYYHDQPLGGIGHLGAFSFHETKNIISGEGGMLVVNDPQFIKRAEIIREKGTNRSAFFRGETDKYNWCDIGSSYLPSEITAAFLWAQLEALDDIQQTRIRLWNRYMEGLYTLQASGKAVLPVIPSYSGNNAHIFYLVCQSLETLSSLIKYLNSRGVNAVFHYQSLHKSPFFEKQYLGQPLTHADWYSECLVRLPLYYELDAERQERVIEAVLDFYHQEG